MPPPPGPAAIATGRALTARRELVSVHPTPSPPFRVGRAFSIAPRAGPGRRGNRLLRSVWEGPEPDPGRVGLGPRRRLPRAGPPRAGAGQGRGRHAGGKSRSFQEGLPGGGGALTPDRGPRGADSCPQNSGVRPHCLSQRFLLGPLDPGPGAPHQPRGTRASPGGLCAPRGGTCSYFCTFHYSFYFYSLFLSRFSRSRTSILYTNRVHLSTTPAPEGVDPEPRGRL